MVKEITEEVAKYVINGGWPGCGYIHEGSCEKCAVLKFVSRFIFGTKVYVPVHLFPVLIFKRKKLKEQPL